MPPLALSDHVPAEEKVHSKFGNRYSHWRLDRGSDPEALRGEQYAVALGLIEDGEVVLGVLGCPNLTGRGGTGALFAGVAGGGAIELPLDGSGVAGEPVAVTSLTSPAEARFCESVESGHSNQSESARIAEQLGITQEPYRIDSQCKYAAIARGDAQIYLRMPTRKDYREKIWDHAGGWMVVTEAGGTVTDCYGKPLDFSLGRRLESNKGVIVTNGPLHTEVVQTVRDVLGL